MITMKKRLNEVDIMDYLDGTLDASRREEVAAYLRDHEDEAQEIADMKLAMGALKDYDESDPIRVSDNFWPSLRDKLPEAPERNWLKRVAGQASAWLVPNRSPLRLSIGAAMIAMFIAMAVLLSGPQQTVQRVDASLTQEETAFVKKAVEQHTSFIESQPLPSVLPAGDSRSADGSDDEENEAYTP